MAKTPVLTAARVGMEASCPPPVPSHAAVDGREGSRGSTEEHFPHPRALLRLGGSLNQRWDLCIHLFLMDLFSTKVSERKGTISLPILALFIISGHYKLPVHALSVSPGLCFAWPHAERHLLLCRGLSLY